MYDAFMVAYGLVDLRNFKSSASINSMLADINVNSPDYEILIGKGNTAESIRDRVAFAKKILEAS